MKEELFLLPIMLEKLGDILIIFINTADCCNLYMYIGLYIYMYIPIVWFVANLTDSEAKMTINNINIYEWLVKY